MKDNIKYVECDCSSPDHLLRFTLWDYYKSETKEEAPEVVVDFQLKHYKGFFGRLWNAIKYLCGCERKYGDWDCVVLSGPNVEKLRDICEEHLKQYDEWVKSESD